VKSAVSAQEDGEVLEGMYAQGCEPLDQARIPASSGMHKKIQEWLEAEYSVELMGNESQGTQGMIQYLFH
jgi:hypothetical protein